VKPRRMAQRAHGAFYSEGARVLAVMLEGGGRVRKDIAAAFGCGLPMLSLLERGHRRPGLELAARIERLTYVPSEHRSTLPMIAWTERTRLPAVKREDVRPVDVEPNMRSERAAE
jgi:hypothetical protein